MSFESSSAVSQYAAVNATVNLLVIRSPDIHRAASFYRALGLELNLHAHGNGPRHYTSEAAGFVFEIYPLEGGDPTTATRFGFNVESVDALVPRLVELGATIVSPPKGSPWGQRAVVKDSDGHTVELVTPPGRDKNT